MYAAPPMANLLVLRSPDIHRAAQFYRALGLTLTLERHGDGPEHYSSSVNGFVFELYPLGVGRTPTTGTRIGFSVAAVDELVPLLRAAGAEVVSVPHDSEWGRRAVVRDLDGHTVELISVNNRRGRLHLASEGG
jgi:catechol 2,3-dioxygenase-like lactoylglutathione lyase family enzyme